MTKESLSTQQEVEKYLKLTSTPQGLEHRFPPETAACFTEALGDYATIQTIWYQLSERAAATDNYNGGALLEVFCDDLSQVQKKWQAKLYKVGLGPECRAIDEKLEKEHQPKSRKSWTPK
jgi:hypothetical protein